MSKATDLSAAFLLCVLGCLAAALSLYPCEAGARWSPEEALALQVARVGMGEAPGYLADTALVWQATQAHGRTAGARLAWLRAHSPCHTGVLSAAEARQRPGNCRWARGLMPDGRRPSGWDRARDGRWAVTRPRWASTLRLARALVSGRTRWVPCAEPIASWGARGWREAAMARGWVPVACKARNAGYRAP